MSKARSGLWLLGLVLACPGTVAGQSPGTRAAGMGTAFVAVADDASAVYWNPAGVATGPYFGAEADLGELVAHPDETPLEARTVGSRATSRLLALSVPPLGLSYYRLSRVQIAPAVAGAPGREDGRVSASRLTTSHWGATLLQSVGEYVTVATTLKLVRGDVASGLVPAGDWGATFDAADGVAGVQASKADVDVGVMMAVERVHLGLVARNLRRPEFGDAGAGEPSARLDREVRVGAAFGTGWPGRSDLILAVDADLTTRSDPSGDRRDVAAGAETWWLGGRLGVRGGVRASGVGARRTVTSAGVSVGLTQSFFVDAQVTGGGGIDRGWGAGARIVF
ncbi:MAG: hypothetical protein AB7H88_02535 [Vicinamibacterales bacterium]